MAFSHSFLDELVARNDIVDVVSGYVSLTKKGGSYWGLCPFHNEKSPSFHVVQDRQIYHCFGCGKGGGVINFVMEMENSSYPEAVRTLAKRVGMEVPEDEGDRRAYRRRERLLKLNRDAARFFHRNLGDPRAAQAAAYFQKRRLTRATVTNFGLGAALDGWDTLIQAMTSPEFGYDKTDLIDAGLAVSNERGRIYDRFRNRVMFPVIDVQGNVIGFGGRVLDDSKPKYLNSPDTMVYNKSRNLFALNRAKKSKQGRLILTEGYMDTISLHQAGIDCAVASCGTALTAEQAQLLARYTKEVVICRDNDEAGRKAAQRDITVLEKTGLSVKVLQMRDAKDADEYINRFGAPAFLKLLDQSENQVEYRLLQVQRKYDLASDEEKVAFLKEAAELIAGLSSPVEQEIYAARAAERAGVAADAVKSEVRRAGERLKRKEKKQQERRALNPAVQLQPKSRGIRYDNVRSALAEEGVLRLVFLDPSMLKEAGDLQPEQFTSELLGRVFSLFRQCHAEGREIRLAALVGALTPEEMSHITAVLQKPESRANGEQAMQDYIKTMQMERAAAGNTDDSALLAYRDKAFRDKKYMEESQV